MVFGPVVSTISESRISIIFEIILVLTVMEPQIAHVNDPGSSGEDVVSDNAEGSAIVGLDGGGWLLVSHFLEKSATRDGFASIDV
jgi:hypothetical protein